VAFELNVSVGEDISHRYLQRKFDAVCLACGAREPRDLDVPGRDLQGIHWAMDYLTGQNRRLAGDPAVAGGEIDARGKRVVVIGGGDTGSDCLGTALRQGAERVVQLEILPRPPERRDPATPWPAWPRILRRTHAHHEGGEVRWSVATTELLGREGAVTGLRGTEVAWTSEGGRPPAPEPVPGTAFELEADLVLLAMGFTGPARSPLIQGLGPALDERGNVRTFGGNRTSVEGVFAAGDMAVGQSLVVRAIAEGREAARGILAHLSGGGGRTRGRVS
jgi:glutamate synthase (NADPH/NADH) small chain